ncbi:unnamed protein product, partial [Didymodactylos carnosus]
KGIFWDDAGFDYRVTRERQSQMLDFCHELNLACIMNAWNPDDVMGGSDTKMSSSDIYLLESFIISNNEYKSLEDWKSKSDKCSKYRQQLGVQMACLSSGSTPISSTFNKSDHFTQAWFGAAMYSFDFFQATDINYSATDNTVYFFPNI